MRIHTNPALTTDQIKKALVQFGTLGSGNHFFEVCLDQDDRVWIVMHSGSRGVGNQLAQGHIRAAKAISKLEGYAPEDPELAWLQENTPEFNDYIRDMQWGQDYAMANRRQMMNVALGALVKVVGGGIPSRWVNCHHNFAQKETHDGQNVWVTRKGAIKADIGDEGVIPGSMGGKSYIVKGLGNTDSYTSCSHGAGRRMSRTQAKKTFNTEEFATQMKGVTWQHGSAEALLDEHPGSYKDIDVVMNDQRDLVEITHELHAIVNYKGTS
jgi:tRNA-splicing ligase RtcB